MQDLLDGAKRERIANLRRNLYEATNAKYIQNSRILNVCAEIKQYLPEDFLANFYEVATGNDVKAITAFIRDTDVRENYALLDYIIPFLIRSLQEEFLLELNNLVERAYKKTDLLKFESYATQISDEAVKVQSGIYETALPRDIFVAYSGKDWKQVSKLVEYLERNGLTCFVAARNLRHGKGSVENYDCALKEAMDHCRSFVFVSSMNSRSFDCDALKIELEYIRMTDIRNAPPEYRNNYAMIPHEYKKPRVEYRLKESARPNAADQITQEFFDGYEWVYSADEVAKRVFHQINDIPHAPHAQDHFVHEHGGVKYCDRCHAENAASARFCSECGAAQFSPMPNAAYNRNSQRSEKQALIRNVCSMGSCDFNHAFPSDGYYSDVIDRDRYNVVYFHVTVQKIKADRIKTAYEIYDENDTKVFENETWVDWQENYDRYSQSWVVRGRDGSFVKAGTYKAVFRVNDSQTYEYYFKVKSAVMPETDFKKNETKAPAYAKAPSSVRSNENTKSVQTPKSTKSAMVTLLLCLFLGVYGAHNFYVGKNGKGVFYLVSCGGFWVGMISDLVAILSGKFTDADGTPLSFK